MLFYRFLIILILTTSTLDFNFTLLERMNNLPNTTASQTSFQTSQTTKDLCEKYNSASARRQNHERRNLPSHNGLDMNFRLSSVLFSS